MLMHGYPFFICQLIWLEKNVVRYTHLSNIMPERTIADVLQLLSATTRFAGKLQCYFCNALGVPFRLLVA